MQRSVTYALAPGGRTAGRHVPGERQDLDRKGRDGGDVSPSDQRPPSWRGRGTAGRRSPMNGCRAAYFFSNLTTRASFFSSATWFSGTELPFR